MIKDTIIKNLNSTLAKNNLNPEIKKALTRRLKDVQDDKPVLKR